jgi:hypothetical protein
VHVPAALWFALIFLSLLGTLGVLLIARPRFDYRNRSDNVFLLCVALGLWFACVISLAWRPFEPVAFVGWGVFVWFLMNWRRRRRPPESSIQGWNKKHGRW